MNRELKFRIWDKKNNMFIYVWDASHKRLAISLNGLVYSGKYDDVLPENDYTIQQYTGLKDKNEKEIYEGDIVKALPATRYGMGIDQGQHDYMLLRTPKIVLYKDCLFKLFDKNDITSMNYCIDNNVEIIGNIFETPELIETNE